MENPGAKTKPLEIHVSGVSKLSQRAERCLICVTVTSSGESQETVSTDVTTTGNRLQKLFKELALKTESGEPHPDAPVTSLSIGSLQNSSSIPSDRNGNPLPRVYSASLSFRATFRDFQKLSEVGSILLTTPHVEIRTLTWKLTDETTKRLGTQSRQLALRDAILKAEDYAQVLGKNVVPLELKDQGSSYSGIRAKSFMIRTQGQGEFCGVEGSNGGIALEPEDVELYLNISVKFVSLE